ncbi:MAG: N-acetylmuramoyl-L-alanine amidase [Ignavibacteriales bacterium]
MKKLYGFIILILIILSISPIHAMAAAVKLVYDGKVHIYNERPVSLIVNGKTLKPKVSPVIMNGTTLVPARAVFEEMGAKVFWKQTTQQVTVKSLKNTIVIIINNQYALVNGKKEKLLMPAKIINENTMIPLRFVSEKLGLKVKWNPETYEIKISDKSDEDNVTEDNNSNQTDSGGNSSSSQGDINSGTINNISFQTSGEKTLVRIDSNSIISDYSKSELPADADKPYRVIVDIPNVSINIPKLTIPVEDGRIIQIRAALRQESPKIVRAVLDLASKQGYSIDYSDNKKTLIISVGGSISQTDKTSSSQNQNNSNGSAADNEIPTGSKDDLEFFNSKLGDYNRVGIEEEEDRVCISINKAKSQEIKVQRVTNPDSIKIDFDMVDFAEKEFMIPLSTTPLTGIAAEKIDSENGEIIVRTNGQAPFQVIEESTEINIYIYKEGYKNIRYENSGAISTIIISNADTTKQINIEQDESDNEARILLPEGLLNTQEQSMYIHDGMVEGFKVIDKADSGQEIKLNFSVNSKVSYTIRSDSKNNFYIYFFARDKVNLPDGDILIAIDAGHGGYDPGAVYKDKSGVVKLEEEDLNLDIAIRLNKILTDLGIPTIMTRTKDEYVELHQRPNLANSMKADLFVSIHNNWVDSPAVSGTMTLYYPYDDSDSGLTSKGFAEIVQEEMLRTIDTTDKKIIARPNLVVLNSTDMPSILVECGFISNESDRNRLTTEEHREKIAQALYTAVIRALGKIEK